LESVIASFYERGGVVRLNDGTTGSVTIGGTVSPAGGNFEEPVTQATLKVVGAFHGLSRARSDARRYPAIDPLESWSKYPSVVNADDVNEARKLLRDGNEVGQMMKVVGEEGTSIDDFVTYLKSEYVDSVYLQQNAFNETDAANSIERQKYVFQKLLGVLRTKMTFDSQATARTFFHQLTQTCKDWNGSEFESDEFKQIETKMAEMIAAVTDQGE
jgi:V/A-type H+-transporting ATPase subunit A